MGLFPSPRIIANDKTLNEEESLSPGGCPLVNPPGSTDALKRMVTQTALVKLNAL